MNQTLSVFLLLALFGCAHKSLQSEAMPQANVQADGGASVGAVNNEAKATAEAIPQKPATTTSKKVKAQHRSPSTLKENFTTIPVAPAVQAAPNTQEGTEIETAPQEASADMGNTFSEYGVYLLAAAGMGALFLILAGRRREQS